MIKISKYQIQIISKLISDLEKDYDSSPFINYAAEFVKSPSKLNFESISELLYGIISLYLIDEITLQPARKKNFIDMASYYYRSDSFNMDFPEIFHNKYKISHSHIKRKQTIFISNFSYITNYLNETKTNCFGSVYYLLGKFADYKIPLSRQEYLIQLFLCKPRLFKNLINKKYSSEFKHSQIYKQRIQLKYSNHLKKSCINKDKSDYFNTCLKGLYEKNESFYLTSSGTAANYLIMKYFDNQSNFFHKYWYFENLTDQQTHYLQDKDVQFDSYTNYFICLTQTCYFDLNSPTFSEDVYEELQSLFKKLALYNKKFNIVIDVTCDPFFCPKNVPVNVTILKTISLSKYQEGINTNFAGLVIAPKNTIVELSPLAINYGLNLSNLDKQFLYIPSMKRYINRISKIKLFCAHSFKQYKGWTIMPIGLSVLLVPSVEELKSNIYSFLSRSKLSDRKFAWLLRDKIIKKNSEKKMNNILYGESFLFPESRITIQGPPITSIDNKIVNKKFSYRLPRFSPGYNINLNNINKYERIFREIINIYIDEYKRL